MRIGFREWLALSLTLLLAAPAVAGDPIKGVINGGDLVVMPGGKWVIASSMAGGGRPSGAIMLVDATAGTARRLYPTGRPAAPRPPTPAPVASIPGVLVTAPPAPVCPGETPAGLFAPQGLALKTAKGGKATLYAVNHGGRESVEMFDLVGGASPRLRWTGCVVLPPGASAHSVATGPGDQLFVTNVGAAIDGSTRAAGGSDVLAWSAATGWTTVPGSSVPAASGLLASASGRKLYVASWAGGELVELSLAKSGTKRRSVKLSLMPGNIHWSDHATILAAGHRATPEAVKACYSSSQPRCTVRSAVADVDPAAMKLMCARPVALDFATVAVDVGEEIWLSAARGDTVQRLPKGALQSPSCE
jgi:hypothetical protein